MGVTAQQQDYYKDKNLAAVEAVDTIHSTSATEQQGKTESVMGEWPLVNYGCFWGRIKNR
jgi:hypothetical protein